MRSAIAIVGAMFIMIGCMLALLGYAESQENGDRTWCNDHGYVYYEPGWCVKTLDLVEVK